MKKIYLTKLKERTTIEVKSKEKYILEPRLLKNTSIKKEIVFEFSNSNTSAKILYRCVAEKATELDLKITLLTKERSLQNVSASLDIHILNLDKTNSITVKPILKIQQQNILFEHKVAIGTPNEKWIKYLNSRGLSYQKALKLIAQGFITGY